MLAWFTFAFRTSKSKYILSQPTAYRTTHLTCGSVEFGHFYLFILH